MKFIAFTTKGLEFVSEKEIKSKIPDAQIIEVADKRIIFESNTSFNKLISLRTVDDLGLLALNLQQIDDLENLLKQIDQIDLNKARSDLSKYRKIAANEFSITASLAGVKKFNAREMIGALSQKIQTKYGWHFTELDRRNFDIRVFIDSDVGYVSIRLTKESLQHRDYKTISKLGSLKPTVAAAMVYLATEGKSNLKIVDDFCGSGTILAEASLAGNHVFGGDIDSDSVNITHKNLSNLGYKGEDKIKSLNSVSTNWQNNYFDCAISNLPWGKQVEIKSITYLYEGSIIEYARILKPEGVLCVIVSKPELYVKYLKRYFTNKKITQFKIGLLGQNPTIVLAKDQKMLN